MKISAIRTIFLVVFLFTETTMLDAMKRSQQTFRDDSSDSSDKQDSKKQKISQNKTFPFVCPTCNKCFSAPGYLKQHQNRMHLKTANPIEDMSYSCSQCDKRFKQKSNLTCHMLAHSEDRPYVCSHCNKNFKHPGHLASHMKAHLGAVILNNDHTVERPFSCSYPGCTMSFKQKINCASHIKKHNSVPLNTINTTPHAVLSKDFIIPVDVENTSSSSDNDDIVVHLPQVVGNDPLAQLLKNIEQLSAIDETWF